jgi:ankyrin repeat protein
MAGFYEAAACFDDPQSAEHLAHLVATSDDLGRSDREGMTLLHYACREGHL